LLLDRTTALYTMYWQGLKDAVKDKLMRYRGNISSLSKLIKASIELDNNLYKRTIEKH